MALPKLTDIEVFAQQYAKPKRAKEIAEKYIATVAYHIMIGKTRANSKQAGLGHFPISTRQCMDELGRFGPNSNQQYWFPILHKHFPLFKTITQGSNLRGEQTVAQTDIPIEILLAGNDIGALFDKLYKDLDFADANAYDVVKINLKNLNNFIERTTEDKHKTTARLIHMVATATDGVLPMQIHESEFGRKYYKGLNLQSCAKVVREAALGACWSIDIENAVVNWKYSMMSPDTQQKLTYTREYIQDKNRIRKHLANVVFGNTSDQSIRTIKRVMTAVGFGARGETNCWFKDSTGAWTQGSISEIIYSADLRNTLFTDTWMMNFMLEQETINKTLEDALRPMFSATPQLKRLVLTESGKRMSKQKMIALAYQRAERAVMTAIDAYARAERLLLVHDGAYYATRPDIASMQTVLRDHMPEARLELTEIKSWQAVAQVNHEHRAHILEEERAANNGVLVTTHGIQSERVALKQFDPHAEPDWETQMMRDFEASLPAEHPEFIKHLLGRS